MSLSIVQTVQKFRQSVGDALRPMKSIAQAENGQGATNICNNRGDACL